LSSRHGFSATGTWDAVPDITGWYGAATVGASELDASVGDNSGKGGAAQAVTLSESTAETRNFMTATQTELT